MVESKRGCDGGERRGGIVAEIADLMQRGRRRTFADAVKLEARRRRVSEFDLLCAAFAENGGDIAETVRRKIERATLAELSERRAVSVVDCAGGIDRRARFAFSIELDFAERLALGMISRERRGPEWLRGGFAAAVGELLMHRATADVAAAGAFSRGLRLVEWTRDDAGRPDLGGGRMIKAPDALAMPDDGAPLGFVTLAEWRRK